MRWGVLGAANFAKQHMAPAIHAAKGAELYALATSSPEKAAGFQAFAPSLAIHDSYDALLADPMVDAVHIPLPNHLHVEWSVKALEAGKHVLCEKPMTLAAPELDQLIAARDKAGKLAAEAFMIVHHPQFARARELVQAGAIGALRHVDVVFSFNNSAETDNIRNKPGTGGGGLFDIGVYAFGAARFVTGEEPQSIDFARIDYENDVDVFVQTVARFPGFSYGATISMRLATRQYITFHGDTGWLTLPAPFNAGVYQQAELMLEQGTTRTVERWPAVNHYVLQVEAFERAAAGQETYACPLEFSRGTQAMIDGVFDAGGRP